MKSTSLFSTASREGGFSLVQVMVAMGLAGGLSVYLMTLTENQVKSQKTLEMKAEIMDIDQLVRQTLRNKENCYHTFKQAFPGGTLDGIRTSDDPNVPFWAEVEKRFKNSQVSIDEMYLLKRSEEEDKNFNDGITPLRDASSPPINPATGEGTAHLRVTYSKGINADDKSRFLGGKTIKKTYIIYAKFGKPNLTAYCPADSATTKTACESAPPPGGSAHWNSIEDPAHLVDIGTPCAGFGTQGYIGNCLHFSPDYGIVECMDPTP